MLREGHSNEQKIIITCRCSRSNYWYCDSINPDPGAANLEIARNATNAQAAAKAISENNQSYTLWYSIGMFCSGLGIALSVGGFIVGFIKKD